MEILKLQLTDSQVAIAGEGRGYKLANYRLHYRAGVPCGQVKGQITDYRFQSAGLGERAEQVTDYKFQTESAC